MYSADDEGPITGGSSEGGDYTSGMRVLWSIERNGDGTYTGGITSVDWFFSDSRSPFYEKTEEEIYAEASANGHLNNTFSAWSGRVSFNDRINFLAEVSTATGCVVEG